MNSDDTAEIISILREMASLLSALRSGLQGYHELQADMAALMTALFEMPGFDREKYFKIRADITSRLEAARKKAQSEAQIEKLLNLPPAPGERMQ